MGRALQMCFLTIRPGTDASESDLGIDGEVQRVLPFLHRLPVCLPPRISLIEKREVFISLVFDEAPRKQRK
jgi:hypothetical protein